MLGRASHATCRQKAHATKGGSVDSSPVRKLSQRRGRWTALREQEGLTDEKLRRVLTDRVVRARIATAERQRRGSAAVRRRPRTDGGMIVNRRRRETTASASTAMTARSPLRPGGASRRERVRATCSRRRRYGSGQREHPSSCSGAVLAASGSTPKPAGAYSELHAERLPTPTGFGRSTETFAKGGRREREPAGEGSAVFVRGAHPHPLLRRSQREP